MEYMKLISGLALLTVFTWLLVINSRRKGFMHAWFRVETILGILAGLYLVATSVLSV